MIIVIRRERKPVLCGHVKTIGISRKAKSVLVKKVNRY
jgi:hypothetical protein